MTSVIFSDEQQALYQLLGKIWQNWLNMCVQSPVSYTNYGKQQKSDCTYVYLQAATTGKLVLKNKLYLNFLSNLVQKNTLANIHATHTVPRITFSISDLQQCQTFLFSYA